MAAGARTSAAAPPSGRSGAAADATRRRGALLLAEFRGRDAQTCTRYCYSPAAMVDALGHALSKLRALYWEATVVLGAWIGAYFVKLFCWASAPVDYKS